MKNKLELAISTSTSFDSAWKDFYRWARSRGFVPIPTSQWVLADYIFYLLEDQNLSISTVLRKLTSIKYRNLEWYGHIVDDECFRGILNILHTQFYRQPKRAEPLTPVQIKKIADYLQPHDRALLLTGFMGALRRSEIVALNPDDIIRTERGALILIRKSKGDQEAKGQQVEVYRGSDARYCCLSAMEEWFGVKEIHAGEPIFRRIRRGDHPGTADDRLTGQSVTKFVKEWVPLVGLNPDLYSANSLRSGRASSIGFKGGSIWGIRTILRHLTPTLEETYARRRNRAADVRALRSL